MGFALIENHDILFLHCTDVRRAAIAGTERYVRNSTADFLVFTKDSETDGIEVRVQDHEVWLTQKGIGQLFDVDRSVVAKHLRNILRKMNYPKVQLVQNLHKLQIMARPITTNSTPARHYCCWLPHQFHPCHTIPSMGNQSAGYIYPAGICSG